MKETASDKQITGAQVILGMPELTYVFDKEGRMLMWNENVELMLGYSKEELLHKPITDFQDFQDRDRVQMVFEEVFNQGKEQTVEYNMLTKSGERIPYLGSGSKLVVNGKEYMIGQAINISKLKNTEEELRVKIKEAERLRSIVEAENIYLRKEVLGNHDFKHIVGKSDPLAHALYRVKQVASLDTTVLLEGETGTGKELFARAIHDNSSRKNKPFIRVNCATLPVTLIESELFGHEKGAFTGAIRQQIGRFELANTGTIFLDEISEIPVEFQAKLLRVVQEREFERIGNSRTIKTNVRIIAATNRKLEEQVRLNLFRKDLFYRLKVYPITIIPLRERIDDIPLLTEEFVKRFNLKLGKSVNKIPAKTIQQLQNYLWPGNIRELENVIERAIIISPGSTLHVEELNHHGFEEEESLLPLMEYERQYIIRVLEKTYWRVEGPHGAARILDMHPETLRSRLRKLEIKRPQH